MLRDVPEPDRSVLTGRGERRSGRVEGNGHHGTGMADERLADLPAPSDVPEPDRPVKTARGEYFALRVEGDGHHRSGRAAGERLSARCACDRVPEPEPVLAGGRDGCPRRAKRHALHPCPEVGVRLADLLALGDVPEAESPVAPAGDQRLSVGAKGETVYLGMFYSDEWFPERFAREGIPEPDRDIPAARGDRVARWAEGDAQCS